MKVTVMTVRTECFLLDVSEELELENFKAFCEVQSGVPAHDMTIEFQGVVLEDNKKALKSHGIRDGDLVLLKIVNQNPAPVQPSVVPQIDFSGIQVPLSSSSSTCVQSNPTHRPISVDPVFMRNHLLNSIEDIEYLKQHNPQLAEALTYGTDEEFARVLRDQYAERERQNQLNLKMLNSHPFDTEAQNLIADEIRKNNIEANMKLAMEYNPEAFGTVLMLYINCTVNGHPVKAFIDSGAQATLISKACAERVNIMRLLDTRWSGVATGVGVKKILGRIHMVDIVIKNDHLTTSFSVLEERRIDMLLGLDMLKRHQCCIDLKKNVLRIGTTGTEIPFLGEGDLPKVLRLTNNEESAYEELQRCLLESNNGATSSENEATSSENEAPMSENGATTSENGATTSENEAAMSENGAATSENGATTSENGATTSENGATTSEDELMDIAPQESNNDVPNTSGASNEQGPTSPSSDNVAQQAPTPYVIRAADVVDIMKLGFNEDEVVAELTNCNGNKPKAIAALLARDLDF